METKQISMNELQYARYPLTINISPGYDDIGHVAIKKNASAVYPKTL